MVRAGRRVELPRARCAQALRVLRPRLVVWDAGGDATLSRIFWELCLECFLADVPVYLLADPVARLWKEADLAELTEAAGLYGGHLSDRPAVRGENSVKHRLNHGVLLMV